MLLTDGGVEGPMTFNPLAEPPLTTADLPGIGGQIKSEPEDFEVEEIPAYPPSGQGDFLYLWVEKRDMGAEYFLRQVAQRLAISLGAVGSAGLKDRRAVTRQMISVPAEVEPRLKDLAGQGIRVLEVHRHGNKLKPGHLNGNRFRIRIRGIDPLAAQRLPALIERLDKQGMANFYGPQRFGKDSVTVLLGLGLLRGETARRPNPFLRKLALSAAQSSLFNHYLARRWADGHLHRVLAGDVMAKWPYGGMFRAEDVAKEQLRLDAREIIPAGPMFGRKMFAAAATAAEHEQMTLTAANISPEAFHRFGKLLPGTRRYNLVYLEKLEGNLVGESVVLSFTLPSGSYASVLLREITKKSNLEKQME
jgi:tRNA pseudouridine13 synthase